MDAGVLAILMVFGVPMLAIWTGHQRKMAELKLQMGGRVDNDVRAALESLRQEVQTLRDTTMQYDLSFDAALQRMEGRVGGLERRVTEVESRAQNSVRVG